MAGIYSDMPDLVDNPQRFGGSPNMHIGNPNPFASFDSLRTPGHLPPPSYNSPPLGLLAQPPWAAYDPQAATPMSWGMSSIASTPMMTTAAPPVAVMPPMISVEGGWPRPLAGREAVDNSPPWKDMDDGYERQHPPPRSNTPLSRSISLSSSPSSGSLTGSLSRKTSLRGNAAEALKRAPRDWRTDFSVPSSGLLNALFASPSRSRSKSFSGIDGNDTKVKLHPYIRYNASKPPMQLDLRESPNTLKFRALKDHALTNWDLFRFVCEPPLPFMRLFHAHLPWYVDVEAQNPSGVTLYELFCAIHLCMMTQIQNADYYNVEMNNEARTHVAQAWAGRCRTDEERRMGIRRVDYLMGRVIMEGIQKSKDGMWEIKTRKLVLP